ncbi:anthranilate phosphoribosyltransferase [Paenibacillus sp. JX-17]|uniref:Anthranilate phosphoribosyltransferase n=1 Tax=Paenibacillus lacisoli TaxID=3064525 RepID=A0ABT9CER9_9BACL|nr:anthranilate phosphoribosyltransferase [Paenibacillus sp. JX-17]MDO7907769.1 anthranilate phosphoribosyltransferase [Paenibacillus sp. JX-17]
MIHLLKEVARGKRGARDLSYDEALSAAELILTGTATPAQTGAFLAAERLKEESLDELQAFVQVCRRYARRERIFPDGLDCASPYDGRRKTFMATFPAAFLLSAAGQPVTLHGCASLPPKRGIVLQDLFTEAGMSMKELTREDFIKAARESGVLYADSEQWCPPLQQIRPLREELDMRTIFNTVEKLVDYGHSSSIVFGIFHGTVFDRLSRLLVQLGYRNALIIQGQEGSEDLHIHRPTRMYSVNDGTASLTTVDPELLGLETAVPEIEWTAELQLRTAEEVLQGGGHMAFYNQTLLNSAVRLQLTGAVDSVEEGVYTCKSLLDSGAAWQTYQAWRHSLLAPAGSGYDTR